ncbi:MAG TPA: ABC-F family ATP-binding cassette domain-containing protein, partial [Caulobacteraceae bacterium]|nr:ABC-F family ATP-binding cassette domain-containing protein [Caulobacteraceae bacterium]
NAQPPLVALRGVRLADGPTPLFDGVDLPLEARAHACLVGRNGAGKSTLLRLLAGLIEPDDGDRFLQPGTRIGLLEQEPSIEGETLIDHATAGGAARHDAEATLASFGLDPDRPTAGLSGGEARRLALARAIAERPDVLLLDEPTNHLDILAIESLERRLNASRTALLIVSHDRAFLRNVSERTFWLEGRRIMRLDKGFAAFDAWAEKIAAERAEELRQLNKAIERESYWFQRSIVAQRHRNEGRAAALAAMRQAKARAMADLARPMALSIEAGEASGRRVIEARKLVKRYGDRTLVRSFSTRVMRGDRIAVVGPNGAGKTTLVRMLLGELAPDAGSVKLGVNVTIAYLDQTREQLDPEATLWQTLAPQGGDQVVVQGEPRHVSSYARDFLFDERQLRQPVRSLSGGERNRLMLARALARPANLLVLDEPTNDLDMETLDLLEARLADYDGTLIVISHDRDFIDRLATSTIALNGRGDVVETPGGWTDFVRQNPGFFAPVATAGEPARRRAAAAPATSRRPAKLSFKDEHRLAVLEALSPKLAREIAALERRLADATLFARDRAAFDAAMARIAAARGELAAAEEEWLALEEKREALLSSR